MSVTVTGPQGEQGGPGPVGSTGFPGRQGPRGPAGPQGVSGKKTIVLYTRPVSRLLIGSFLVDSKEFIFPSPKTQVLLSLRCRPSKQ